MVAACHGWLYVSRVVSTDLVRVPHQVEVVARAEEAVGVALLEEQELPVPRHRARDELLLAEMRKAHLARRRHAKGSQTGKSKRWPKCGRLTW